MEDLLKDLTQAKPPAPEVDPERMERDLARIIAMPRPAKTRISVRRFGPVLVAAAVIALTVMVHKTATDFAHAYALPLIAGSLWMSVYLLFLTPELKAE